MKPDSLRRAIRRAVLSSLPTRRGFKALAATLGLALAFSGLTVVTTALPAVADGTGQAFSCSPPTFFALSENPVGTAQLYKGTYGTTGTATFTALGATKTGTSLYNALAYNPQDGYLYGTAYGSTNAGHLIRIDSAGNTTDVGAENTALGTPPSTLWDSGEFDASGNYYVMDGNAGTTKLYVISGAASAPTTVPTTKAITLSASVTAADFSLANGYLWAHGYGNSNFYRINPTTGTVSTYSSTVIPSLDYGSAFTMGNGNLAFISTTGMLEQVAVANPTATPTFSLVSAETAPTNQRSDATNCVTRPTDLSITKTGTPAVLVNGTITWTLTVHNAGPGVSTGFVVNDALPTTIPTTTAPTATSASAGCTVTGRAIACNGSTLAVGADATITITAKAPATTASDVVNTATVIANEQDLVSTNNSSTYTTKVGPQPIAAVNDTATTADPTAVNITVLANDTYTGGGVTAVSTPGHGSASINADGTVKYTPAAGFSGTDTFTYTLTDVEGQTKTATVTVTVTPTAVNDTATTTVGASVDVNVVANDNGTGLTLTSVAGATHGTVSVVAGKARFVPTAGYSGTGTFSYVATDGSGRTTSATVTVSITPAVGNDAIATTAGSPVTDTTALSNDSGTGLSITAVTNGSNGSVVLTNGLPVYTPAAGFSGTDTFTYTVTDGSGQQGTATVTVTVAPTAMNDTVTTPANASVSAPVLTNDLGKTLSVTAVTQPAHGSVAIVSGLPVYTPTTGYSGPDSFGYTLTGAGGTSSATVTVTVNPVAVADTASVEAGDPVTIDALANDIGKGLSLTSTTNGAHGSVAIVGGKIVYGSTAGYSGADTFTYTITDTAGHTSTISDTITVTPDPTGVNDTATTIAGSPVTINVIANDNGTGLTLQSVTNGSNGTVTIVGGKAVYTSSGMFSGTDTFTYTAKDAGNHTYGATVTVTVTPNAQSDAASTPAGVAVTVDAAANDIGTGLAVTSATNGAHGSVTIVAGKTVYTPAAGYSGADSFTYTVTDSSRQTGTAAVSISVTPIAVNDAATTNANASISVPVLANDLGTGDTVTSVTQPANGSVVITSGLPVYTPKSGFSGADSFSYSIKDTAGNTSTATVTMTVKPVAIADTATTPANTSVSVGVLANDLGSSLAVSSVTNGTHGSVSIVSGQPVYIPATAYSGSDSFSYTLTGSGGTSITTVAVQVTPVAIADTATTAANTGVDIPVVSNDLGSGITLTSATSAVNGTVTVVSGKAHFMPTAGFSGTGGFSYIATDSANQTTTASVTVTVSPVAVADTASTVTGTSKTVDVLANDLGTGLTVASVTQPTAGTVVITGGKPVYSATSGFSGTDAFTYTLTGAGGTSTATVTMTVSPLAVGDTATTEVGDAVSVPVLANDIGKTLSVTGVTNGSHGTVAIMSGLPVYTPAATYVGGDSFTYMLTGAGGTSTTTVAVTVVSGPSGSNDAASTNAGTAVSIPVLTNDSGSSLSLVSATNGSNGTVTVSGANAVYTPASGFSGTDTFSYTGKDAKGHTYTATVTVTISPVAVTDSATTTAGSLVDVAVLANDLGTGLTLSSVATPVGGTVSIMSGKAEFVPAAGFSGAASFSYIVTDSSGRASTASVAVTVAPRAIADAASTNANTAVIVDALANDLGSALSLQSVTNGAHGTATIAAGRIVYTPATGYSGPDSISYAISGTGGTSTTTIALSVLPVALNDSASNVSGDPVTVPVLANDLGASLSVVSATNGTHGTVSISSGVPVYTPAAGYAGTDSFGYTMTDASGNTASATVTVTVQAAPTAANDTASTQANSPVAVSVLANDSGTALSIFSVTNGSNGTVAISGATAVYTPNSSFSGTDTFGYVAKDSTGHAVTATVTVTVTPVAKPDTASTKAGVAVSVNVVANDLGTSLLLSAVGSPIGGTVAISSGQARFTPSVGFSGAASFGYTATDATGQTTSSTVSVAVAPTANADVATTIANTTVTIDVLSNDLGSSLAVSTVANGSHGSAAISAGKVSYTPAAGFSGTDSFSYSVSGSGGTDTATVSVTVLPTAVDDSATSVSGDPVAVDVLANDLGTGLTVTSVTQPAHGSVVIAAGKPVYTPTAGYFGSDTFQYTATDAAGDSTSAEVSLTVQAAPTAKNDSAATTTNRAVTVDVLANDTGLGLTLSSSSTPTHGSAAIAGGRVVYTPAAGFSGTDAFTYLAKDSTNHPITATVTISVAPIAVSDIATTVAGNAVDVDVTANDLGTGLAVTSVSSPVGGGVIVVGSKAEFTPVTGFSGAASFSYIATDSSGQTVGSTVAVTVTPKAVADAAATSADTAVSIPVLANDLGTTKTVASVGTAANGTAVISGSSIVYTPAATFSGTDSFSYTLAAGGGTSTALVTVTVTPVAVADTATSVSDDPTTIDVLANDLGSALAITSVTQPSHGAVALVSGKPVYTPVAGYAGTDSFTYFVSGDGGTASALVTLTVTAAPTAANDSATTTAGTPATVAVLGNDTGSGISIYNAANGSDGTTLVAGNSVTYTPAVGFSGTDSFGYVITDSTGHAASATVSVTVTPVALADAASAIAGSPVDVDVLANDLGSALVLRSVTSATGGTVAIVGGKAEFTPAVGFSGAASFAYTAADSANQTTASTVTVTVAPRAMDDAATTTANTAVTISALANDLGSGKSIASVTSGADGTAAISGVTIVYTPATNFSGTDTIHYTLAAAGGTAVAAVTISVAPVAANDSASTLAQQPITIDVAANDAGSSLHLTSVGSAAGGTVAIVAGKAQFTPSASFSGAASFAYTVTDASGQTSAATVAITVAPVAMTEAATTTAGTAVTLDALANDLGSALSITAASGAAHGTVSIVAGKLRYTPAAGFSGPDVFSYTASGAGGLSTVSDSVTVLPVALADTASNLSGAPVTIDALANDLGTGLAITDSGDGAHGTVEIVDGKLVYTPTAGYAGQDSFSYTATDAAGASSAAIVTVTVQAAPTAADDTATTTAGVSVTSTVLANDSGLGLALTAVTNGSHGTATAVGSSVKYLPAAGYSGVDRVGYTATDTNGVSVSAQLVVTVTPVALNDTATTTAGVAVDVPVTLNDFGTGLSVTSVGSAVNGTVALVGGEPEFTPAAGFSGAASFAYTVTDASYQSISASVSITVKPAAITDSATTDANTAVTLPVLANDLGWNLAVSVVTDGSHGTVTNVLGSLRYSPAAGFSGADSFSYTITGDGGSATVVDTVTVLPVTANDSAQIESIDTADLDVLANDLGTALRVTAFSAPTDGSVAALGTHLVYTPNAGSTGIDTFTYTATDSAGNSSTATVTVTVTAAPTATDDAAATIAGVPTTIDALSNDSGIALTLTGVTAPSHGAASIVGAKIQYKPAAGFSGTDTFSYTAVDSTNHPVTALVTVTVSPLALADTASASAGAASSIAVLGNDLGSNLTVSAATDGAHGTVAIVAGLPVYTPASGFSGTDSFGYTITGDGGTSTTTVTVTVAPTAVADTATTSAGNAVTIGSTSNDLGTNVAITLATNGSHGTVALVTGEPVYTPAAGFSGTDSFGYAITGDGGTSTTTVTVTVIPVAVDDVASTPANLAMSIPVLSNDVGSTLTVVGVTNGADGTAAVTYGGVSYTPTTGFSGTDSFTYTVQDASGQQAVAAVSVTVKPVAASDSATTPAGSPINLDLLANDAGSNIAVTSTTASAHGDVAIQADGTVTYTPHAGYSGLDSFTYTATQQSAIRSFARFALAAVATPATTTATVTIDVTPVGVTDTTSTVAGGAVTFSPAANDLGLNLTVTSMTSPVHGTVVIVPGNALQYKPSAGYSGPDTFTYTIKDRSGQVTTATVLVTVIPVAVADSAQTAFATPVTIDVVVNDLGASLVVTSLGSPSHGSVSLVDGAALYSPDGNFSGSDSFSYEAMDATGQTASGTVNVLVLPIAPDDSATTPANTPVTVDALANDGGTGLVLTSVGTPTSGTASIVDNTIHFVPATGFSGQVTMTYTSQDDAANVASATVTIFVTPIAVDDQSSTAAGSPVTANPTLANTGTGLLITHVGSPSNGTAWINAAGTITYQPRGGYSGIDRISYTTTDAVGQTATAFVTIDVKPIARADVRSTRAATAVSIPILMNDTGSTLTVTAHTSAKNGTVTLAPSGVAVYDPAAGFVGTDRFSYSATDASGQVVSAMVTVTVDPVSKAGSTGTPGRHYSAAGLAYTGSDPSAALYFALLLLVSGVAVWIVGRRRRRSSVE